MINVLQEQDYQRFELSLNTDSDHDETEKETVKWKAETNVHSKVAKEQEVRVGIKDWSVYLICINIYNL